MTSLVWGVGAEMTDEANPHTKEAVALGTRGAVSCDLMPGGLWDCAELQGLLQSVFVALFRSVCCAFPC